MNKRKKNIKLSVLIVNFNLSRHVYLLCKRLLKILDDEIEILVYDNNSTDNFLHLLQSIKDKRFSYHYSDTNIGYGSANNYLARLAKAPVFFLLNPDTIIDQRLSYFKKYLRHNNHGDGKDNFIIAPKIFYPNGVVQHNFYFNYSSSSTFIPSLFRAGALYRKFQFTKLGFFLKVFSKFLFGKAALEYLSKERSSNFRHECAWVSGAAFFVSSKVFCNVKGFDKLFFLYSEDEDFCRRAKLAGAKIIFDPSLSVIHQGGGTQKKANIFGLSISEFHKIISSLNYLKKYNNFADVLNYKIFVILSLIIQLKFINNWAFSKKILKAVIRL